MLSAADPLQMTLLKVSRSATGFSRLTVSGSSPILRESMPRKPGIFLDTSVAIDLSRASTSGRLPTTFWKTLSQHFRYFISPFTVYELISGLATAQSAQFVKNREAIRMLYPSMRKRFLPLLRVFMPSKIFGDTVIVSTSLDNNFELWIKAVLKAPDQATLESDKLVVDHRGRKRTIGLDLAAINKDMRAIQEGYAKRFHELRAQKMPLASIAPWNWSEIRAEPWADMILTDLKKELTDENRTKVVDRLDAAYRFDAQLWASIKDKQYDFSKHRSEIVDAQQLYYLCDPDLQFVTAEKKLKNKLAASSQANRILTLQDLYEMLGS